MYGYNYFNLEYKSLYDVKNIKYPEDINNLKNRTNDFMNSLKKSNKKINILLVSHMTPINVILNNKRNNIYPQGGLSLIYNGDECFILQKF